MNDGASDARARLEAVLAGRYRIDRELGAGGMAIVYLAHDLKHDRPVALKAIRPEIAVALGTERFLKEIRATANLNHPNILPLHDSGTADGIPFYVMPLIDGETLRERLDRERQLPIDDALSIARGVAEGLAFAHRSGLIHRDIKPANILLHEGTPLIADFGCVLDGPESGEPRLTETGFSLGTPGYMSPEQVSGDRELDGRTDVYALGCVVYEMLAGDPPFAGSSRSVLIARILAGRPLALRKIRPGIPAGLDEAVLRALSTAPADRFGTATEFADALSRSRPTGALRFRGLIDGRWPMRAVGLAILLAAAVLVGRSLLRREADADAGPRTIRNVTTFVGWEWAPTWSPDGSQIAYSHIVEGDADIATIPSGGGDPHILTGDSPADEFNPSWSPDGSKIAYVSDRGTGTDVYWIAPTGGAEHKITETGIPFLERMGAWSSSLGANAWSPDSRRIVFSRLGPGGEVALWTVELGTGQEVQLTHPPPGVEDGAASWSRDGSRISFGRSDRGVHSLMLIPAEGGEPTPFLSGEPVTVITSWFPDDRRVAISSAAAGGFNIWEWDVDRKRGRPLTSGAGANRRPSVSNDGSIAYVAAGHEIDLHAVSVESPEEDHERLTTFTGDNFGARFSPDGDRIAYYSSRTGNHDLWILDRSTGQHRQLTDDPAADRLLDWSPDGAEIVFLSNRDGPVRLWIVDTETGVARRLSDHELPWAGHMAEAQGGPRWAPDGSHIGYLAPADGGAALWLVDDRGGEPAPTRLRGVLSFGWYLDGKRVLYTRRAPDGSGEVELRAAHLETGADELLLSGALAEVAVSPDGEGLSYLSAVSHFTMELYVLALSPPSDPSALPRPLGEPRRVTFGNGVWHAHSGGWSPDGSTIVYSRDRDFGDIHVIEPPRE